MKKAHLVKYVIIGTDPLVKRVEELVAVIGYKEICYNEHT